MRLFVALLTLCPLLLSRAHAQTAASDAGASVGAAPSTATVAPSTPTVAPAQPAQSAVEGTPPAAAAPASNSIAAPPPPPAPLPEAAAREAVAMESQIAGSAPLVGAPVQATADEAHATWASRVRLADSWVAFEGERDRRTRTAEKVFFPLALGLQAALGAAYAVGAEDVSDTSRIIAGTTAGLALASMVPTILSRTRGGRRGWFSAGSALFAFGAGATIITADSDDRAARWAGASVAVQGLALLPLALIPGFPDEEDYQSYLSLPESQRPAAAARLLARVDRFEQRVTAISIVSALVGAAVLATGALTSDDKEQARTLAGLSLIPLGTMLVVFAPRLFVRSRVDRYGVGDAPTKLPFNGW